MFIHGIGRNDWVLEIGSGHEPYPRSDVLLDKYLDNRERASRLVTGRRPFFLSDANRMPFKDKSFDFVICSHVLEHATDVKAFLDEVQRVGKAGYIETPSEIWEMMFSSRDYHRWIVLNHDGCLRIRGKEAFNHTPFEDLFDRMAKKNKFINYIVWGAFRNVFITTYYWRETIRHEIIAPIPFLTDLRDPASIQKLLDQSAPPIRSLVQYAFYKLYRALGRRIPYGMYPGRIPYRRFSAVLNHLECVRCRGDLVFNGSGLRCRSCEAEYPIRNGMALFG